jgi:uncharacterized protein YbbC (DUF1343 family)
MRWPAIVFFVVTSAVSCRAGTPPVSTGADLLVRDHLDLLRGKRVGLVTNQTGRCTWGEPLVDALLGRQIRIVALFSPEHGFGGTAGAGIAVSDSNDSTTGIRMYSLYGATKRPTGAMLANVDILVYDIQDVGVRYYTYISTMVECMSAAAAAGMPFVVLDRPDPQGGLVVDGPVLPDSLRSFVGPLPLPVVYGLTVGELAVMANGEGWLDSGRRADLTVVWMEGWKRGMNWQETGLPWIPPSPNMPTPEAALVYPMSCYLEATAVSEGRGTPAPFNLCGAPFVDGRIVDAAVKAKRFPFVRSEPAEFTPGDSKHRGRLCSGIRLSVTDDPSRRPVEAGVVLLDAFRRAAPDSVGIRRAGLNRLLGDPSCISSLEQGLSVDAIARQWLQGLEKFMSIRRNCLHYPPK